MDNQKSIKSEKSEKHEEMIATTHKELIARFKGSNVIFENHKNPKKYSQIFHEFMEPAIKEILDDENGLKNILDWGQLVWNKAIAEDFPENSKSRDIEKIFPFFRASFFDQTLISHFINRKKELFSKDSFFIEQTSLLDSDGRLCISIAVSKVED